MKKNSNRKKLIKITAFTILTVLLLYIIILQTIYIPRKDMTNNIKDNNAFNSQKTLNFVSMNNYDEKPKNTLLPYISILENNINFSVDGFKIKVYLSKDNRLFLSESNVIDDFCDCTTSKFNQKNVRISEKTSGELKQYNYAYNYKSNEGIYQYRNTEADLSHCRILSLNELLSYITSQNNSWKKKFKLFIELGTESVNTAKILHDEIKIFNYFEYTIVLSDNKEQLQFIDTELPNLKRAASNTELLKLYYNCLFNTSKSLDDFQYDIVFLNSWNFGLNFQKTNFILYSQNCGISIIFDNINSAKEIEKLLNKAPNGICGNNPQILYESLIRY